MGGVIGILLIVTTTIPESSIYLISLVAFLVSGLVLSARLKLQAHTPLQVYFGFLLGLVVSFMLIFWV
jgi:membrane-associated phospholipid phosphatase